MNEAGLSRSSSYEVGRQVIAAAQVREELADFAGRLGLYRPLPRAQELGLLPSVDDAGGVLEPHARRECTASGLSLYVSRRHRQLAGHLAGRSVWRLRGQGCAYAAFKNIHFNPACAARWWPTLILPPKSALVRVTRAYTPAISALVRRREQALTYDNCVGPRTRAYTPMPTHAHTGTMKP